MTTIDVNKAKLSPSMDVEYDPVRGAYKVFNKTQNDFFYTSKDLLYILECGKAFYRKKNNNYFVCDNYYGKRKYFHQIAKEKELEEFGRKYKITPLVDHIDRNRSNNVSSNLRVVSPRLNAYNSDPYDDIKYIGVKQSNNYFRMYITDPINNVRLEDRFCTEEEAAMAYDYYVSVYYPQETFLSNIETNRYPEGFLENLGINDISEIVLPESNRDRCTEHDFMYYGLEEYNHANATYLMKVEDINGRGSYPVTYGNDESDFLRMVMEREDYLNENSDKAVGPSNVAYHEPKEGMISVVGIVVPKNKSHVIKSIP